MNQKQFEYDWSIKDIENYRPRNGYKVFSTFCCGGGSTLGYKLAGFEVLGGLEIDTKVAEAYRQNNNPKYLYTEDIRTFKNRTDLPIELYNLDILDGSPPCTPFTTQGLRDKIWGVKKAFNEGSTEQTLDDLFFHFIDLVEKLQPKIVVAENVKGLTQGKAKVYLEEIIKRFEAIGYRVKTSVINAKYFQVPQSRERVIFVAYRKDIPGNLRLTKTLHKQIPFKEISDDTDQSIYKSLYNKNLHTINPGQRIGAFNSRKRIYPDKPTSTLMTRPQSLVHPVYTRYLNLTEMIKASTFPRDYNFMGVVPDYILGMSVPPLMMAHISESIAKQILYKLNTI